jgi:hypothetical protein
VVDRHGNVLREYDEADTLRDGEFVRVPKDRMTDGAAVFDHKGDPACLAGVADASHLPIWFMVRAFVTSTA